MRLLILVLHVVSVVLLIGLVLLQHGKGADMGAAFGSGSSNTMFGSAGAVSFLVKVTAVVAAVYFATSIILNVVTARHAKQSSSASLVIDADT